MEVAIVPRRNTSFAVTIVIPYPLPYYLSRIIKSPLCLVYLRRGKRAGKEERADAATDLKTCLFGLAGIYISLWSIHKHMVSLLQAANFLT